MRWIDGTDVCDGSDLGAYSGTPDEVHNDGRYWSAAMRGTHADLINSCALDRGLIDSLPTDTTPPGVQAVVNPATPDGANGFYRGEVSVSWQVTEPEGGLTFSGCGPTTIH